MTNDCEHFVDGKCAVAGEMVTGSPIPFDHKACVACKRHRNPKQPNHVTASIALRHLQKSGASEADYREKEREVSAWLDRPDPHPSAIQMASEYLRARKRWIDAGRPERSDEQVNYLFNSVCRPCEHYVGSEQRGKCSLCHCQLNLGSALNKLRWATESCPDVPPRWTADE